MSVVFLIVVISCYGLALGVLIYFFPTRAIDLQIKFYEKINWRVEPISLPKEVRNTKAMGLLLLLFVAAALIYLNMTF